MQRTMIMQRWKDCLVVLSGLALCAALITPCYGVSTSTGWEVVAHRGYSNVAPESTLAAIDKAIEIGAQGCEFDVRDCLSGEVILMHDETVDRTNDGVGYVNSLTLTQLKQLDAGSWFSDEYIGQRIPTFDEALARLKNSGTKAVCEIKETNLVYKVVSSIVSAGMVDQAAIISFDWNSIKDTHALNPQIPAGLLFYEYAAGVGTTASERADWFAAQAAAYNADFLDIFYPMLTEELVDELHQRGQTVWVWTPDYEDSIQWLHDWGVDSITTDRPDFALPIIAPSPEPSSIVMCFGIVAGIFVYGWRKRRSRSES